MTNAVESLSGLKDRMAPVASTLERTAWGLATERMDSVAEHYPQRVMTALDDLTVRAMALSEDARHLADTLETLTMDR